MKAVCVCICLCTIEGVCFCTKMSVDECEFSYFDFFSALTYHWGGWGNFFEFSKSQNWKIETSKQSEEMMMLQEMKKWSLLLLQRRV